MGHALAIVASASRSSRSVVDDVADPPVAVQIAGAVFAIDDNHGAFGAFDDRATENRGGPRMIRQP